MGRAIFFRHCALLFCSLMLALSPLALLSHTRAGSGLDYAEDSISNTLPNKTGVQHAVSFTLPIDAQQVRPGDFILIDMPNFVNVTAATSVLGGFGTPQFGLNGNTVSITNVALLPGSSFQVLGITATNAATPSLFRVTIAIATDSSGTTIRNQASVIASGNLYNSISVSASIQSPLSSIDLSGYTSPNSFTTLIQDTSVLGTTSASSTGYFHFSLSGINTGSHTFNIFSSDDLNRTSSQAILNLFLTASTLTSASNIILSPTLSLDKAIVSSGDTLTVSGESLPSAQVTIFTESPLRSYSTTSSSSGAWSYTLPAAEMATYSPGAYRLYSSVQDNGGNQSIFSPTLNFTVNGNVSDSANPQPGCDISHGDLNCDGKTSLADFSILLFYWHTNQHRADINKDGKVDLIDFSIMMFFFKR
jgi:hypothetical protein